jgi:hypothetical protein
LRSSFLALAVARALVEACALAVAGATASVGFQRQAALLPLWLDTAAVLIAWIVLAPYTTTRVRTVMALGTVALGAALALLDVGGVGASDGLAALLGGAIYASVAAWRAVSIVVAIGSWRAAASSAATAAVALTVAALVLAAKRDVVVLAVVAGIASTIGLSLSRGVEETFAGGKTAEPRRFPGWLSSAIVALGSLLFAASFPRVGPELTDLGERIGPYVRALIVIVVTPFIYVIDAFVRAIVPLLLRIHIGPTARVSPEQLQAEEEYAREFSLHAQAFLERVVIAIVLAVIAVFVARAVLARLAIARAPAALEREHIDGVAMSDLLRGLFAQAERVRPPRPAGEDPAARVRRAYWDLLALAERAGRGWRAPAQTPREHRAALEGAAWRRSDVVVAAFERIRYAGVASAKDADDAERALHEVAAAVAATG